MAFTVLSDDEISAILENLHIDDLDEMRHVFASALHEFSTNAHGTEEAFQQPHRLATVHPVTGTKSLYMPSSGPPGMSCKVISLPGSIANPDSNEVPTTPTGVINLFSPDGQPLGLVHAKTLTAFRTALASTCLLNRRATVKTITVFGAGLQAYWHVRLALMMRGSTIRHVNVINHRFSDSAGCLLKKFTVVQAGAKEREGWSHTKFGLLTPTFHEYGRLLKEQVRDADVIYCCTPSTKELFDEAILTSHEGRRKGRLIVAVGSHTPGMRELPDGLLQRAVKQEKPHLHFHKHAPDGGVIVVDTLEGALKEAGEIIHAKVGPNQLVELGELVMLHRQALAEAELESPSSEMKSLDISDRCSSSISSAFKSNGENSPPSSPASSVGSSSHKPSISFPFHRSSTSSSEIEKKKENHLVTWLAEGNVIYKSVGMGLMDLVAGMMVMKLAEDQGVGTKIPGF